MSIDIGDYILMAIINNLCTQYYYFIFRIITFCTDLNI